MTSEPTLLTRLAASPRYQRWKASYYEHVEPCENCNRSRYEHYDHAHEALEREQGQCPFRDCGPDAYR